MKHSEAKANAQLARDLKAVQAAQASQKAKDNAIQALLARRAKGK